MFDFAKGEFYQIILVLSKLRYDFLSVDFLSPSRSVLQCLHNGLRLQKLCYRPEADQYTRQTRLGRSRGRGALRREKTTK